MIGPKNTTDAAEEPTVPALPTVERIAFRDSIDVAHWPEDEPSQRFAALALCQKLLGIGSHDPAQLIHNAETVLNWINGGDGEVDG